jgi:hypothetical protein
MLEWFYVKVEKIGQGCPDKVWLANEQGDLALFKPDTGSHPIAESQIELYVYNLATEIGVNCARVELYNYSGSKGMLSHNFHQKNLNYVPAGDLFPSDDKTVFQPYDKTSSAKDLVNTLSFQEIVEKNPTLLLNMIKMTFLDCLISNFDRNSTNWEFEVLPNGNVLGLAPLFDHAFSMENNFGFDDSLLHFEKPTDYYTYPSHFEFFEKLCQHYPYQISDLMSKTEKANKNGILNEFVKLRFEQMKEIFHRVQSQKDISEIESPLRGKK